MIPHYRYTIDILPARSPAAESRLSGAVNLFRTCFGSMLEYEPSQTLYASELVQLVTAETPESFVVGAILSSVDRVGPTGHIHWAATRPGLQQRGIGKGLLWAAEQAMLSRGCTSISLAPLDTPAASAFWNSQGFAPSSTEPNTLIKCLIQPTHAAH